MKLTRILLKSEQSYPYKRNFLLKVHFYLGQAVLTEEQAVAAPPVTSRVKLGATEARRGLSTPGQPLGRCPGAWGPAHGDSRALGHHGEAQHAQPHLGCAQDTSRASYASQPLLSPGKGSQSPEAATGHHL